jgi:hypothetical protein
VLIYNIAKLATFIVLGGQNIVNIVILAFLVLIIIAPG